ncbi:MAG: DoxX family protein [Bryobacteraceae bacterium]
MSRLAGLERLTGDLRRNRWLRWFAVFCRIALALGFIPAAIVKMTGERFTGLPSNNPLGHYFDALHLTGYYYTFIGISQLMAALLLLIPRAALTGAIFYFPIILNIFVLTHATRFDGTRIVTLMLLANVFLLVWDFDRLKCVLPFCQPGEDRHVAETSKFPFLFFGGVVAVAMSVIVFNDFLFDIRPGNEEAECTNGCKSSDSPNACQLFCDCIYKRGNPLNACLSEYRNARKEGAGLTPPVR